MAVEEKKALVKFFNAKASEKYGEPKFNDIYNLEEGLKFLTQHYDRNKGFTKAVKEMTVWLKSAQKTQNVQPSLLEAVLHEYTKLF